MFEMIFQALIYFLAIYGTFVLAVEIVNRLLSMGIPDNSNARMVILVKNLEDKIEGIIRLLFLGQFLRKTGIKRRLAVVDMGSTDKTTDILNKLKKDYEYMDVFVVDEKSKVFSGFSD